MIAPGISADRTRSDGEWTAPSMARRFLFFFSLFRRDIPEERLLPPRAPVKPRAPSAVDARTGPDVDVTEAASRETATVSVSTNCCSTFSYVGFDTTASANGSKGLTFVTGGVVAVESEFARDSCQAVYNFNKLVLCASERQSASSREANHTGTEAASFGEGGALSCACSPARTSTRARRSGRLAEERERSESHFCTGCIRLSVPVSRSRRKRSARASAIAG